MTVSQRHLLKLASASLASGVLGVGSGFYPEAVAMVVFAATLTVLLASRPAVRERTHCDLAAVVRERE